MEDTDIAAGVPNYRRIAKVKIGFEENGTIINVYGNRVIYLT